MKDIFPGYYRLDESAFRMLWQKATFALDANVLLNLYRYPVAAREDLLAVLKTLSSRLLIPYQAALEYQRGRLPTIAAQRNRFGEVRKLLDDTQNQLQSGLEGLQLAKRHSSINPDRLLTGIGELFGSFLKDLDILEEHHPDVSDEDRIRKVLDEILTPRIGPAPTQAELDAIYAEGKKRYEENCPPGYENANKAKQTEPVYTVSGLRIERQYGDLLVWKQMIAAAKQQQIRHLVLVTDDDKPDWWWKVKSNGQKTIGPRPELIEEATRDGGVSLFYMYNSEQFIRFAKEYLGASVKAESIDQIGDVRRWLKASVSANAQTAELAVFEWLKRIHRSRRVLVQRTFPDYIVELEDGERLGYEVKLLGSRFPGRIIRDVLARDSSSLKRLYVVLVAVDAGSQEFAQTVIPSQNLPPNLSIVLGHLEPPSDQDEDEDDEEPVFIPDFEHPRPF